MAGLEQGLRRWNARKAGASSEPMKETAVILSRAVGRSIGRGDSMLSAEDVVEECLERPSLRLAVYGSLAPGKVNAHVLELLAGVWTRGIVRGRLRAAGWGSAMGFPGLIWDMRGPEVAVQVLYSESLARDWQRIDDFEGEGYQRILVPVECGDEIVVAHIYTLRG